MVTIKTNPRPLLLEIGQSKEERRKSSVGINVLSGHSYIFHDKCCKQELLIIVASNTFDFYKCFLYVFTKAFVIRTH